MARKKSTTSRKNEITNMERGRRGAAPDAKRESRPMVRTDPGDNEKFIRHNMQLSEIASHDIDMTDEDQVRRRIVDYFTLCAENDMKPSSAGFALVFDVDRTTIGRWAAGQINYIPNEVRRLIKRAYSMLNAQTEDYMQAGKINPVAGIFLLKNNFGYKDEQSVVLTPVNMLGEETAPEELRKKYLNAIDVPTLEETPYEDETEE